MSRLKEKGGLRIGGIVQTNQALLGKVMEISLQTNILWASIIRSKLGHGLDGWSSKQLHPSTYRSPWKGISLIFLLFSPQINHSLGNGYKIRFWADNGLLINR